MIKVNMDKARDIKREHLRQERAAHFAAADQAFMRALEAGKPTAEIVQRKTQLRDATQHPLLDQAETIDQLRELTIDQLV